MADKSKKTDETGQIDKHLNSKLFQKFLQKEGDKLSEVNLIGSRNDPPRGKIEPSGPFKQRSAEAVPRSDYPKKDQKIRFEDEVEPFTSKPKFVEEDEVFIQDEEPNEIFFGQSSLQPQYEDRPKRSKWQDDPYQGYQEEYPRDSELKGFSDYIPPGESFVYFDGIPENPQNKPKPTFSSYYPDPLNSVNSSNQKTEDLEERLRSKEIEINKYKQDIERYRNDIHGLEDKLESLVDVERRLKNLRTDRDMFERKSRNLEEENNELKRQNEMLREDLGNARYKNDETERSFKNRLQDLEREIRGYKERVSDLERELSREREKSRLKKNNQDDYDRYYYENDRKGRNDIYDDRKARREDVYDDRKARKDDFYEDDRKPRKDDFYEDDRKPRKDDFYEDDRKGKRENFYEDDRKRTDFYDEPRKGKKQDYYEDEPRKNRNDYDPYSDRKTRKEIDPYQEKAYPERFERPNDDFRPDKIKEQVKARIGATNSSSVSSALNWGEKPRKNDEVLSIESKILSLQIEKKRYEDELAKIPEHGKKIAVIRRREEIENELANIHSNIANLKIKVKQLQSKDN